MEQFRNIVLIDSTKIIDVVRRTLSKIDPRLMDHGDRVGYIAKLIYDASSDAEKACFDFSKLYILCVLHDIGAYKTNEIDDMVQFETLHSFDHALYGYLFLKNTTHLKEDAEALLYHHTDFSVLQTTGCRKSKYASMIFLADRVDILLHSPNPDLSILRSMAGTRFDPAQVEALMRAEKQFDLSAAVLRGDYLAETQRIIASLQVSNSNIMDYLRLLVYAIDFRSPFTVTHTADTTLISMKLGRLLHLKDHALETLYIGAFLHDIGKIAIPHDILEKPGRLTPEEYEIVKKHIDEGDTILRGVVSDEICDIALRHHEKLDGSGYRLGLREKDLTLPQRIVAVADILSALSQRRSYKEPFPKEKVLAILTEMRDAGQLCPLVVNTACLHYDTILSETENSHNPVKRLYSDLQNEYSALAQHT